MHVECAPILVCDWQLDLWYCFFWWCQHDLTMHCCYRGRLHHSKQPMILNSSNNNNNNNNNHRSSNL